MHQAVTRYEVVQNPLFDADDDSSLDEEYQPPPSSEDNTPQEGPNALQKTEEIVKDVEKVAADSLEVVDAVTTKAVPIIVDFAVPLLIFIGIGFTLVFLRTELIKGAPYISSHAKKFAAAANGFDKIFAVLLDTVKGLVFVVRFLLDLVAPNHAQPEPPNWFWPTTKITGDEVVDFADAITFCSDTTTDNALKIITQYTGNTVVCPVLRAATPLRWINTTILPAFDWLAFNYTPMAQDEETGLGNCRTPDDYRQAVCAGLQAGHILLEIMIPVAVGALLFISLIRSVLSFVASSLKFAWTLSLDTLHIIKL